MAIRVSRQRTEALILETPEARVSRQRVEALTTEDADLRVSRQRVEALVVEDGEVRVSRQCVEVLFTFAETSGEGTSSISLGSNATANVAKNRSVENTLSFSQEIHANQILVSASSTLGMGQSLGALHSWNKLAENTLSMGSSTEYRGPISVSAGNEISFEQLARIPKEIFAIASSTISVSQDVIFGGALYVSASNTVEFKDYADEVQKFRDTSSILSLGQSVAEDKATPASNQIVFSQSAHIDSISKAVSSTLAISQVVRVEPFTQLVSSTIEVSQAVRNQFQFGVASSPLEFGQNVIVAKPICVSVETELTSSEMVWDFDTQSLITVQTGLRQDVGLNANQVRVPDQTRIGITQYAYAYTTSATAISGIASNMLSFSQDTWASTTLGPEASSLLAITQISTGDVGYSSDASLTLGQSISYSVTRAARLSISELGIGQSVTYTLVKGSSKYQYSPFVGESDDPNAPDLPPAEIDGPMWGIEVPFQLVYPSLGTVTDSVALKTPNLGNKDRLSFNRVLRETRGGTLIVFADPIWPKVQTLVLTFSGLFRVEAHKLQTFINDHLGQEIGLIDWEHRYWRGVITSPNEPLVEDKFDSFTTSFDFEGDLDPTWDPQIVPLEFRYSPIRSEREDGYYIPSDPILPTLPGPDDYYTAIASVDIDEGRPIYITGMGEVDLAKADSQSTTEVIGFVQVDCLSGETCRYLTEGKIERLDWTTLTGMVDLSPGEIYFLDSANAGRITATAPTTLGEFVVRVGRAVSTRTLDIEIELPILL